MFTPSLPLPSLFLKRPYCTACGQRHDRVGGLAVYLRLTGEDPLRGDMGAHKPWIWVGFGLIIAVMLLISLGFAYLVFDAAKDVPLMH